MTRQAITVSQLNEYIKNLFSSDSLLTNICVMGEISNYKQHSSGHLYFTLKDEGAVISAVMFKGDAYSLRFEPKSGMKVFVTGRVSVYPKNGQYQVYVNTMQPDGLGSLYMAYEQLKEKLYKEGLFDQNHKKPIPLYPKKIALITSPTGAAVRDMIRILRHRYPLCDVMICPVKVQGDGSAAEIAAMIDYVSEHTLADLIITGRGGGSLEDLWAFNEEIVARAIYNSAVPIISAVGHEPDITISDYVADLRAATPSNAAELAVPDQRELSSRLRSIDYTLGKYQMDKIQSLRNRLKNLSDKPIMQDPKAYFNEQRMRTSLLADRLESMQSLIIERKQRQFQQTVAMLDALSPLKVLTRGYAVTSNDNGIVTAASALSHGDTLMVRFADGESRCIVDSVELFEKEQDDGKKV